MYTKQNFINIEPADVFNRVQDMKAEGYRLVQICCTTLKSGFEVLYSFDLDGELVSLRLDMPANTEIDSISKIYWPAFIYENEMKDLFGLKIRHIELDFGGHFFRVAEETPWAPKTKAEVE